MTENYGISIEMDYPGLGTGAVIFRLIFSKALTDKEIAYANILC